MSYMKLMYITNEHMIAVLAETVGVDRIIIDMEYIGKYDRQGRMDTVQSHHTTEDVVRVKSALRKSQLMVRCNPIHEQTSEYCSSREEIDKIVASGADIIMLPYFKTADEVRQFVEMVGGRAKTFPLVETKEAVEAIDEILDIDGIDEIYVGLNDLSLSYGKRFMFELLADGTIEYLASKFNAKGIPFGFGGIASIGEGLLHSENIIKEHYRLGSSSVILSRSFCNVNKEKSIDVVEAKFENGIRGIRALENECARNKENVSYFEDNSILIKDKVRKIVSSLGNEYL